MHKFNYSCQEMDLGQICKQDNPLLLEQNLIYHLMKSMKITQKTPLTFFINTIFLSFVFCGSLYPDKKVVQCLYRFLVPLPYLHFSFRFCDKRGGYLFLWDSRHQRMDYRIYFDSNVVP
jgi:hypothetical protein